MSGNYIAVMVGATLVGKYGASGILVGIVYGFAGQAEAVGSIGIIGAMDESVSGIGGVGRKRKSVHWIWAVVWWAIRPKVRKSWVSRFMIKGM